MYSVGAGLSWPFCLARTICVQHCFLLLRDCSCAFWTSHRILTGLFYAILGRKRWKELLKGAAVLGVLLFFAIQLAQTSEGQVTLQSPRKVLGAEGAVPQESAVPPLWGWDAECLPNINRTWTGGRKRTNLDPLDLELPLAFWSAIASVRDNGTTIVITGPQYTTKRHRAAPGMSPKSNFHLYKFECHFVASDTTIPGVIEVDPHKNLGIIKCPLPANEPMAKGESSSTKIILRDLTHDGTLPMTACSRPISSHKFELSAVVAARGIACHLEEWLENLFMHGFDHVFFYDHFNDDSLTHSILKRYILQGLVTVFPWRMSKDVLWGGTWDRAQIMLYTDGLYRFRTKWLFVGDVDEFPFLAPLTVPEGTPEVRFYNQTKIVEGNAAPPPFILPDIPHYTKKPTRSLMRESMLDVLDEMDRESHYTLGAIELRQLLFGTSRGADNRTQPHCLPDGKLKLREQVMRGTILPSKNRLSEVARKYIARTDRVQVASIHMIAKGGPIVQAPMNRLRLHHYWRSKRATRPENNLWVDTSAVRWADIVQQRIEQRRYGSLVGLN